MEPQTLSRSDGALRWLDEGGMPRATNEAWRDTALARDLEAGALLVAQAEAAPQTAHVAEEPPQTITRVPRIYPAVRQITGKGFEYHSYVYQGNRVVKTCDHKHRSEIAATQCAKEMVAEFIRQSVEPEPAPLHDFRIAYYTMSDCQAEIVVRATDRAAAVKIVRAREDCAQVMGG